LRVGIDVQTVITLLSDVLTSSIVLALEEAGAVAALARFLIALISILFGAFSLEAYVFTASRQSSFRSGGVFGLFA